MRHTIIRACVAAVFLTATIYSSVLAKAESYEIDPVHSMILFRVNHMGIGKVFGRINEFEGIVVMDEENLPACSFVIEIDPASVDTNSADRDKHLTGPDFFNVKQFPVWRFKSTSVAKNNDGTFKVTGEMQLHGAKKTITIEFEKVGQGKGPGGGYRTGWYSEFSINRSDFGMDYMLDGLSDEIQVYIAIEGIRK